MTRRRLGLRPLAAVCLLILAAPVAQAALPADAVQRFDAAYAALDALAAKKKAEGALPRLQNPADRKVLDRVLDANGVLGTAPYTAKDLPGLLDIFQKQTEVDKLYVFFSPDPAHPADPDQNGFTFQDEVTRSEVFLTNAFPALLQSLYDFASHLQPSDMTESRKQGLVKVRSGLVQFMSGWAATVKSPQLHEDNRAMLVDSMGKAGPSLAASVPLRDRATILGLLQPAYDSVSAKQKASLSATMAAMASQECKGFCTME